MYTKIVGERIEWLVPGLVLNNHGVTVTIRLSEEEVCCALSASTH
jgi:hypothetical protein